MLENIFASIYIIAKNKPKMAHEYLQFELPNAYGPHSDPTRRPSPKETLFSNANPKLINISKLTDT